MVASAACARRPRPPVPGWRPPGCGAFQDLSFEFQAVSRGGRFEDPAAHSSSPQPRSAGKIRRWLPSQTTPSAGWMSSFSPASSGPSSAIANRCGWRSMPMRPGPQQVEKARPGRAAVFSRRRNRRHGQREGDVGYQYFSGGGMASVGHGNGGRIYPNLCRCPSTGSIPEIFERTGHLYASDALRTR